MSKFNPISHAKRLIQAGVPSKHAHAFAEEFAAVIENNLATKDDLRNVEQRLDSKINQVEAVLLSKIAIVDTKIAVVDTKLNWLMTLIGLLGGLLTIVNFLHIYCS